jgi:phage-related protein
MHHATAPSLLSTDRSAVDHPIALDRMYGKQYISGVAIAAAFYKTAAGAEPVREWLKGLPKGARKTIGSDIGAVEAHWPIGRPLVDGFGAGLWEVRSTHEKVEYRVQFGIVGSTMYLLHGLVKKTRATTNDDKDLAYRRLAEVKADEKLKKK